MSLKNGGIPSAVLVGETDDRTRSHLLGELRAGRITFLFTRDVLSEGLDVPEVNTVLFLSPTESLTVFLQQLGRGLRHAPEKDCLTVLDLVGQVHRCYRLDLNRSSPERWAQVLDFQWEPSAGPRRYWLQAYIQ